LSFGPGQLNKELEQDTSPSAQTDSLREMYHVLVAVQYRRCRVPPPTHFLSHYKTIKQLDSPNEMGTSSRKETEENNVLPAFRAEETPLPKQKSFLFEAAIISSSLKCPQL